MAKLNSIYMGIHIHERQWSSSRSKWSLILNSDGIDVLNRTVDFRRDTERSAYGLRLGGEESRGHFPPEGFARVFSFFRHDRFDLISNIPSRFDWIPTAVTVDTATLNPSSARFNIHGDDLIRPLHVLLWGLDTADAVVPLCLDIDLMGDVSDDVVEGLGSIPLTLVNSGTDSTPFREVALYVGLGPDDNARTQQPVSFRIEDADGALLFESQLENFFQLEPRGSSEAPDAKIWRLIETRPPLTRVDPRGRGVVAKLRVDGPDNAMIDAVVAFGVNRDNPSPLVVPLVNLLPVEAGTNQWVGTHQSAQGRDMILPLCATASRQ